MKLFSLKIHAFAFIVTLTACDGFLSDADPSYELSVEEVFRTAGDLEAAVTGAYHGVQHGNLLGRNTVLFADLLGPDVDYRSGAFLNVAFLQMDPSDFYVENLWRQAYKTINHLNAILDAVGRVAAQDPALTPEAAAGIEGEALFLRGVIYFELARLFCQPYGSDKDQELGLPIELEPVLAVEDLRFSARNSVAEVYQQALADVDKARELLPGFTGPNRANRYTALAWLARIASQMENYENVAALTEELIQGGPYSLNPKPQDFFTDEGSEEEIWAIFNAPGDDIAGFGLSSVYHPSGPNEAHISDGLRKDGYEAVVPLCQLTAIQHAGHRVVDLRVDPGILSEELLISPDTLFTNKYENQWLQVEDDTPMARLADFMLMRAEALARTGGLNQESVNLLNQVRERSIRIVDASGFLIPEGADLIRYKLSDFQTPEELIAAILLERRVELAFEGQYFHDLMRLKKNVRNLPSDAGALRLPIPQREIDANPNLKQNPYYE